MPSKVRGKYKTDAKIREDERSPRDRAFDAARAKKVRAAAKKRRTEREFLKAIVEEISLTDVKEIAKKLKERCKKGDPAALAFLGRYVLGGGKVSLTDVARPPMIRRTKR